MLIKIPTNTAPYWFCSDNGESLLKVHVHCTPAIGIQRIRGFQNNDEGATERGKVCYHCFHRANVAHIACSDWLAIWMDSRKDLDMTNFSLCLILCWDEKIYAYWKSFHKKNSMTLSFIQELILVMWFKWFLVTIFLSLNWIRFFINYFFI